MTTFYILLDGDTEKDVLYATNVLGEESFGKFYPSVGYTAFNSIINNYPEWVEYIQILDDQKKEYTIDEFLDVLEKLKIKST